MGGVLDPGCALQRPSVPAVCALPSAAALAAANRASKFAGSAMCVVGRSGGGRGDGTLTTDARVSVMAGRALWRRRDTAAAATLMGGATVGTPLREAREGRAVMPAPAAPDGPGAPAVRSMTGDPCSGVAAGRSVSDTAGAVAEPPALTECTLSRVVPAVARGLGTVVAGSAALDDVAVVGCSELCDVREAAGGAAKAAAAGLVVSGAALEGAVAVQAEGSAIGAGQHVWELGQAGMGMPDWEEAPRIRDNRSPWFTERDPSSHLMLWACRGPRALSLAMAVPSPPAPLARTDAVPAASQGLTSSSATDSQTQPARCGRCCVLHFQCWCCAVERGPQLWGLWKGLACARCAQSPTASSTGTHPSAHDTRSNHGIPQAA